jgi:hypothetical protein
MSHMARSQIARCNQTNSGRSGASISARSISSRDFPGVPSPESGCASQAAVARLSGVACTTRTATSRSRSARRCDKSVPLARVAVHPPSPNAPNRTIEIDHFAGIISLDLQLLGNTHVQFLQQHVTHLALKTRPFRFIWESSLPGRAAAGARTVIGRPATTVHFGDTRQADVARIDVATRDGCARWSTASAAICSRNANPNSAYDQ